MQQIFTKLNSRNGSFTNYVDKILGFLTTYPPVLTISIVWTLTKSGHFWTTCLPRHVNVVCERPLMDIWGKTKTAKKYCTARISLVRPLLLVPTLQLWFALDCTETTARIFEMEGIQFWIHPTALQYCIEAGSKQGTLANT